MNYYRRFFATLLALALASAASAQIYFEFTATFVNRNNTPEEQALTGSSFVARWDNIASGPTRSRTVPADIWGTPAYTAYDWESPSTTLTLTIGGTQVYSGASVFTTAYDLASDITGILADFPLSTGTYSSLYTSFGTDAINRSLLNNFGVPKAGAAAMWNPTSLTFHPIYVSTEAPFGQLNLVAGGYGFYSISAYSTNMPDTVTAVPEPSTYATIFGLCALGLVAYRRRQRAVAA